MVLIAILHYYWILNLVTILEELEVIGHERS